MNNNSENNDLFVYKYQPYSFNDFEIKNEFIDTLKTLIKMDNLNILFIGDVGSGKTSFLNAVVNEYYDGYSNAEIRENILHINSLKEQGINYYRNDVKTFSQTNSSIKNKKKIIILDDIDFINEQSQQVFRNCLDKYSHNVHFIASCTNIQKVIESLQSRLTIIRVEPLSKDSLKKIMNKIVKKEQIYIKPDAEDFILSISNNSAKILINYIEKFKLLDEEITIELAQNICTNISFSTFEQFTELLKLGNLNECIKIFYNIFDKGYSVMDILDNYFLFVKTTNILNEEQKYNIIPIICKYITVFHNIHEDEIELALFTNNLIQILSAK